MNGGAPSATVIIPAKRADDVLGGQLTCLAEQDRTDFEVLVADADRHPTRALERLIARWQQHVDVKVVEASGRVGCGAARNVALGWARAPHLLFCDADDLVAPTWVSAHLDGLAGADLTTGPKAMIEPRPGLVEDRARLFATATFSSAPNTAGRRPYASGGNAGWRRDALVAIGGFATHNLNREDAEASWLALDRGYRLAFAPEAKLLYVGRADVRSRWRQNFAYGVGLEALRRQFDGRAGRRAALVVAAKRAVGRSAARPDQAVPAMAGLCGQLSEHVFPGRFYERARERAGTGGSTTDEDVSPSIVEREESAP